jgi:basic membrane protein A and related proteins
MRNLLLALLIIPLFLSCDRNKTTPPAVNKKFRVALLLPGSDNDKGWNQLAREGLDRIKADLAADARLVTKVASSEYASQIKYFADDGYDLIICHGGEFEAEVAKAAAAYPKTRFIVGGCPNAIPGATSVEFLAKDASRLAGVVAARVSRSKTAGFVGAMAVPTVQACYDGFADGIKSVTDANVKTIPPQWTNSWDSAVLAKEKAEAVLGQGADVVYQNVDAAATGVFEAVAAANKPEKPAYAFGCNSNQNGLAPNVILGSVVIDVPRAYFDLAKQAKDGKLSPGPVKLGLKDGYVDLVLNEKHPAVTDAVRTTVDASRRKLLGK